MNEFGADPVCADASGSGGEVLDGFLAGRFKFEDGHGRGAGARDVNTLHDARAGMLDFDAEVGHGSAWELAAGTVEGPGAREVGDGFETCHVSIDGISVRALGCERRCSREDRQDRKGQGAAGGSVVFENQSRKVIPS